jgi:hypothetical protein
VRIKWPALSVRQVTKGPAMTSVNVGLVIDDLVHGDTGSVGSYQTPHRVLDIGSAVERFAIISAASAPAVSITRGRRTHIRSCWRRWFEPGADSICCRQRRRGREGGDGRAGI